MTVHKTLEHFFNFIELEGTLDEKSATFVSKSQNDKNWVFGGI